MTSRVQREIVVADLYNQQTRHWHEEEIRQLLGPGALQSIQATVSAPRPHALIRDRLIWLPSKKGTYTVKEGYQLLVTQNITYPEYSEHKKKAWKQIWSCKEIIPRVKTFLWRAVHDGLAVTAELHRKIRSTDPSCPRCGQENEFLTHMCFFCLVSRATWFISDMSLRVNDLPLDFTAAWLSISEGLSSQSDAMVCNTLWNIWKTRNEYVFTGKRITPQLINMRTRAMHHQQQPATPQLTRDFHSRISLNAGTILLQLDGSWDANNRGGTGILCFDQHGKLTHAQYQAIRASSPLHAEAVALLQGLQHVVNTHTAIHAVIFSDCQGLIKAVTQGNIDDLPHWQAADTVAECIALHQASNGRIKIIQVRREALQAPHKLANWARTTGQNFTGQLSDTFMTEMDIEASLSSAHYQLLSIT